MEHVKPKLLKFGRVILSETPARPARMFGVYAFG